MKRVPSIGIIGVGFVGATVAYTLLVRNVASRLFLFDIDKDRCRGELLDLQDASLLSCIEHIEQVETISDLSNMDIVVIAAGKRQKKGQKRENLLRDNVQVIESIAKQLKGVSQDTIIILVTNPVDLLTCHLFNNLSLPSSHILGSGTMLDTQRLRYALAQRLNHEACDIDTMVIGQHGDVQVPLFSMTTVNKQPISLSRSEFLSIAALSAKKAYEIIEGKNGTYYGVASCVAQLCIAILNDTRQVFPVISYHKDYDCCFSLPVVLGKSGIERVVDINLTEEESHLLEKSIQQCKITSD